MITIATLFWQANRQSKSFSTMYDESWVEKLYRGFARNLSDPFRFVCYVDRARKFAEPIDQRLIASREPGYSSCVQPYEMGVPMILVGLDTVVTGSIDHLARSCFSRNVLGLPRDPYKPTQACNGVGLVPAGFDEIARDHNGENDMEWVRRYPHRYLDDEFPGQIVSYKGHAEKNGIGDARIVYFHGARKPHELRAGHPILEHWR